MNGWLFIPVFLSLVVTLALWTALRLIFWARAPQNMAGALALIAEALIVLGFLGGIVSTNYQVIILWNRSFLAGLWLLIPSWFIFVALFTGYSEIVNKWVNRYTIGAYLLFFIILAIIYQIPTSSSWIIAPLGTQTFGPFQVLEQKFGWIVTFLVFFGGIESILTATMIGHLLRKVQPLYRLTVGSLILSLLVVCIALFMQAINLNPIAPLSPVVVAVIPSIILKSWMFFALRVGQEQPVVREKIVEYMWGSVIVLDAQQRVTYLNPSAVRMLKTESLDVLKKPIADIAPVLAAYLGTQNNPHAEVQPGPETVTLGDMVYSLSFSVIQDWKGETSGQILVLQNVTDRERMEQTLQARAIELARSGAFTQALSQVAANVAASSDLNQVYQSMSTELHGMGIDFLVALNQPGQSSYAIEYLSLDSSLLSQLERLTGVAFKGFGLPGYDELLRLDGIEKDKAIYFPNMTYSLQKIVSKLSRLEEPIMRAVGATPEISGFVFPLATQNEKTGIFAVWGKLLSLDDFSALASFAAQVSAAVQKARLIADLVSMKSFNEGIVQGVADAIVMVDSAGIVAFANPAASQLIGAPAPELVGQKWSDFIPAGDQAKIIEMTDHLTSRNETGLEISILTRNGRTIPVLVSLQPRLNDGHLENVLVSLMDIEKRVITEQELRASNQEKEALLKEIHHRVKNNLQIISSLLNLQSNLQKDLKVREIFRESQNRVRSMALIHEKLYQSENLSVIRLDEYIQDLGNSLLQAYENETNPVQLIIQADPITVDIDTAIPCGLIVNELVTNSLKHAFAAQDGHESRNSAWIKIQLGSIPEGRVRLSISDNGAGFPPNLDFSHAGSLGLQLVSSLVRQVEGNLVFGNQEGACVEIDFSS